MSTPNWIQNTKEEITEEYIRIKQENINKIESMNYEQLSEYLDDLLIASDIVIEGMDMANTLSSGESIAYRALIKLAQSIELIDYWIKKNIYINDDSDEEDDDDILGLNQDSDDL